MSILTKIARLTLLTAVGSVIAVGGAAADVACEKAAPDLPNVYLDPEKNRDPSKPPSIDLGLRDKSSTTKCRSAGSWTRLAATISPRPLRSPNQASPSEPYKLLSATGKDSYAISTKPSGQLKGQALSVAVYVEHEKAELDGKFDLRFASRNYSPILKEADFQRLGADGKWSAANVYSRIVSLGEKHRLVLIVCIDTCDAEHENEVYNLELSRLEADGAGEAPQAANQPPPPQPALKPVAPVLAAPAVSGSGVITAPRAPIRTEPPKPTSRLILSAYDGATGMSRSFEGWLARAMRGDCSNRDDFGPSERISREASVPIYGPKPAQATQPLCLVMQQQAGDRAEACFRIPAVAVADPIADKKPLYLNLGSSPLPACEQNVRPWLVRFILENGQPIDRAMAEVLIDNTVKIAGLPLMRDANGAFMAPLRLDDILRLQQPQAENDITLDSMNFTRLRVDIDQSQRAVSVVVKPEVVSLAGISFEFRTGDPVTGQGSDDCELRLDIPDTIKRGNQWTPDTVNQLRIANEGQGRYSLRLGQSKDSSGLDKLFVGFSAGNTVERAIILQHNNDASGQNCYLSDRSLRDDELAASQAGPRVIRRKVGQPQPGLLVFVTPDKTHATAGLQEVDYTQGLKDVLDVLADVSQYRMMSSNKPFEFVNVEVTADGRNLADQAAVGGGAAFSNAARSAIQTGLAIGLRDRTAALPVSGLRRAIEDVFKLKRNIGPENAPPAAVVHVGGVYTANAASNFCNSSLPSQVNNTMLPWLGNRQLLKISFARTDVINRLVQDGTVQPIDQRRGKVIFACAYNVKGRVEDYIVVVPNGQIPGAQSDEVATVLRESAQGLFGVVQ